MDLQIVGRHLTVTEAMHAHVAEKLEHIERYDDQILRCRLTLSTDGDASVAELVASGRKGATLVAEARAEDMYKAIDAAAAKLESQVHRHKERLKGHRARTRAGDVAPAEEDAASDSDEWDGLDLLDAAEEPTQ